MKALFVFLATVAITSAALAISPESAAVSAFKSNRTMKSAIQQEMAEGAVVKAEIPSVKVIGADNTSYSVLVVQKFYDATGKTGHTFTVSAIVDLVMDNGIVLQQDVRIVDMTKTAVQ